MRNTRVASSVEVGSVATARRGSHVVFSSPLRHRIRTRLVRLKVGITDGFVRVSCGVENTDDLSAALKKGLDDL